MKKIILLASAFTFLFLSYAQSQCTNPYYRMKTGTVMVTESYDAKDKITSRSEATISEYQTTPTGFVAEMQYKLYDKKDKLVSEGSYKCECDNDEMRFDMSAFVPAESMQAFKDMEVTVKSDELLIPANLKPGVKLPDASYEITTKGTVSMKMTFNITDRVVEGMEKVTTPAGTFDCAKLTYNINSKMMMVNTNLKSVQYMAENYGAVKTETYRANGKFMGYTVLTKFEY